MIYQTKTFQDYQELPKFTKDFYDFGEVSKINENDDSIIVSKKHFHSGVEIFIREVNSLLTDFPNIKHIITDLDNSFLEKVINKTAWEVKDIDKKDNEDVETKPLSSYYLHLSVDSDGNHLIVSNIYCGHFNLTGDKIKELLTFNEDHHVRLFSSSRFSEEVVVFYDDEGLMNDKLFLLSYDCLGDLKRPPVYLAGPIIFTVNKLGVTYPFIEGLDDKSLSTLQKTINDCTRIF